MKELKRYLAYIGKCKVEYWSIFIMTLATSIALSLAYPYMNKLIFNALEYGDMELFKRAAILCTVLVVANCLAPYRRYFQIRVVRKIVFDIKIRLFDKLMKMDMNFYEKNHSGEVLKTLNQDANSLKDSYFSHIFWVTGRLVTGVTSILAMLFYSPVLAAVSVSFCLVTVWVSIRINKQIKQMDKEIQVKVTRLSARLSDILAGFTLLKMYDGGAIVVDSFHKENKQVTDDEKRRVGKAAMLEMVSFVLGILASFGTIAVGAILVAHGKMDYGTVMAVVSLQMGVATMVQRFGAAVSIFSASLVKAGRVFDFLEREGEECFGKEEPTTACISDGAAIEIDSLGFSYDGESDVLHDFCMSVKKGEKIMIMGESGCGKSTLLKLIMRFYEMGAGEIKLYGRDVRDYELSKLRELITYIPQESYLFEGTIRENIAYGCATSNVSKDAILNAAKLAYADEFIRELPDGYETQLSAGGHNLSGGQRQRIAIARAFLKDAPILLMDEPSSALDVQSEKMINQAMKRLMAEKVVLMVTHRATSFDEFDRVVKIY